jgi:hypothetical protein
MEAHMMNTDSDIHLTHCGRHFSDQEIEQIQNTVSMFPKLSRRELSETICEHLEWYTASGTLKWQACQKFLIKMEQAGAIKLPVKARNIQLKQTKRLIEFTERTESRSDIIGTVGMLDEVTLEIVLDKESKKLWQEYMARYHYLGSTRPFGCYLRYFIKSSSEILGCALFSGAAKSIGERDRWIGWTENQRLRNLSWIINNTRFLIFPWVKVKNLASHVLGKFSRYIRHDWYEKWGYSPVLMETFVDGNYYSGTCYKAANWKYLGMTTGEGLVRNGKSYKTSPKYIFAIPLAKNFRKTLCSKKSIGGGI